MGISAALGLPWGLAFCTYGPLKLPGIYLFTIFNALQGTLMLILLDFLPLSLIRFCVGVDEHDVFSITVSSRCFCVPVVPVNHMQANFRGEEYNKEFLPE